MRSLILASVLLAARSGALLAQTPAPPAWDSAALAWDRGRYQEALVGLERILVAPGGERWLDSVALLTGERYRTIAVAPHGNRVEWSPDGRYAAIETGARWQFRDGAWRLVPHGADSTPRFTLLRLDGDTLVEVGGGIGFAVTFLGATGRVGYLAGGIGAARVVVRDIVSGAEQTWAAPDLDAWDIADAGDGRRVIVTARVAFGPGLRTDLVALDAEGRHDTLAAGPGFKTVVGAAQDGAVLVYRIGTNRVAVRDRAGSVRGFSGSAPSLARDGSALVFVGHESDANTIAVLPLREGATPAVAKRTWLPLGDPALSPDARRVVFQMMPREDWELYLVGADGSGERRLTREIQHDLLPEFLAGDLVLAKMGEQRHRRSYLYDLVTGARIRLFHNNTVRTVAPEYDWAASPDGTKVLIVADRDGDTVSPERGVYLVDLARRVSVAEVLRRIRDALAAERDLEERGRRMFAPVAARVRAAVAGVSVARIDGYAHDLFAFDSKFITRPGNRLAIDYLERRLREFGYQPELQWFEPRPGVRSANVVVRLRGTTTPELAYVAGSHFDSVEDGPGADDDASGTCALLEAARVLAYRPQPATIVLVFYTAEEAGLRGSSEFVRRMAAESLRVVGGLNNDMIGWTNDHRLDNTIRYSNAGLRDLQHAAAFLFTDLITYDSRYYQSTDAHSLYDAYGDVIAGIGSYPILGNPHYHQPHDVLETINQRLVAEVSKTTVASLMLMASSPSRLTGLTLTREQGGVVAVWTAAPEREVRGYRVAYGPREEPLAHQLTVAAPRAVLPRATAGMVVQVRAVMTNGLEGWDWTRAIAP